jgi:leucyl-tRNA synthetase
LRRTERDRTLEAGAKTGVFTGSHALNPATREWVPIFVADYVLTTYGLGAIMAVPAHDERDFSFAQQFGLPIRRVVAPVGACVEVDAVPFTGVGVCVSSASDEVSLDGLPTPAANEKLVAWLESSGHGGHEITYRLRDWLFSRQRYWGEPFPIVYDDSGLPIALPDNQLPVELPDMQDFKPRRQAEDDDSEPQPPLSRAEEWVNITLDLGDGKRRYRRETNTMPQWAGSCWYYLRYLDPANSRVLTDPIVEKYWMGSWETAQAGGVDLYVGGVEHGVLHLLYARLWHKILYDLGHVSTPEPFHRLVNQGYILADAYTDARGVYRPADEVVREPDGTLNWNGQPVQRQYGKMGKSLKNSIAPDEIYAAYGADTLRLYEMYMGPIESDRPWRTDDIVGVHRFLQRLWRNVIDEESGRARVSDDPPGEESLRLLHRTVEWVARDYERLHFNTALAKLMELNNHLTGLARNDAAPRVLVEPLVLMLAPLAPHIAEELWSRLGHPGSLAYERFPEPNAELLRQDTIQIPVQVNGRVRFQLEIPADADEDAIRDRVLGDERLERYVDGGSVRRVIAVPGQIVSVVVTGAS